MPMIDVYATAGTFADKHKLAVDLATAVMVVEGVPDIPMFRQNTPRSSMSLPPTACRTSTATTPTSGYRCSPMPAPSTGTSSWPSLSG